MFKVTDRAAQQLKTALSKAEDTENACFRMGIVDNKVQLVVDQQRPGDTAIEHEGETLVVLDPGAGNALYNRELDFDNEASGLVLKEAG
jgi:Fe-S cluster assembly iron-binding protein IscA